MRDYTHPEEPGAPPWADALLMAALLAVDPGLGGAALRARPGPARDAWLSAYAALAGSAPLRLPPAPDDEALHGGLDLAATLASGREIRSSGLLATDRPLLLPMAERAAPCLAARLAQALDGGALLLALDEGFDDERAPAALLDRLAFRPDLFDIARADLALPPWSPAAIRGARARLDRIETPEAAAGHLVALAAALGIDSLRAPLLALRAARAAAALEGEAAIGEAALARAARFVLGPRATRLPTAPEEPSGAPEPLAQEAPPSEDGGGGVPDEVLLEAARAAIPPGLLARLLADAGRIRRRRAAGAGGDETDLRRGRPAGTLARRPRQGARIALLDTLRAAAPWQPLRRRGEPHSGRILVRGEDIRLRRFRRRAERVVIFAVDASGSTALARLAEAKGAIELMLADAYSGRHSVALVAFRGAGAELLLPPTRGLVAAKRRLAALPGGGGTPLAAGIVEALAAAERARAKGLVPTVALLTDGRANVARDGSPGRLRADADAQAAAAALRAMGIPALLIDSGNRPSEPARALARAMGARYLPLPRADARALAGAVAAASA